MKKTSQTEQRRLVIGDIHGRFAALKDVLDKCKFRPSVDRIIILGDVVDRGPKSKECVDELLKIPEQNRITLRGNHDWCFHQFIRYGIQTEEWLEQQGGYSTLRSYMDKLDHKKMVIIPKEHKEYFESAKYYHIEDADKPLEEQMVFVHAGFRLGVHPSVEKTEKLMWDRELVYHAMHEDIKPWKAVFVGHTRTQNFREHASFPLQLHNVILMDCGAGSLKLGAESRVAIMDIDTREYWTSNMRD